MLFADVFQRTFFISCGYLMQPFCCQCNIEGEHVLSIDTKSCLFCWLRCVGSCFCFTSALQGTQTHLKESNSINTICERKKLQKCVLFVMYNTIPLCLQGRLCHVLCSTCKLFTNWTLLNKCNS